MIDVKANRDTKFSSIEDFRKKIKINEGDELKDLVKRKEEVIQYVNDLSTTDTIITTNICEIWDTIDLSKITPHNIITKKQSDKTYGRTASYDKVVAILYGKIAQLVKENSNNVEGYDLAKLLTIINTFEGIKKTKLGKDLCLLTMSNDLKTNNPLRIKRYVEAFVNSAAKKDFIETLKLHSNPLTLGNTNSFEKALLGIGEYLIKNPKIMQEIYNRFTEDLLEKAVQQIHAEGKMVAFTVTIAMINIEDNSLVRFTAEMKRVFVAGSSTPDFFKNKQYAEQAKGIIEKLETFLQSQNKSDNIDNSSIVASKNNQKIGQEFLGNKDIDNNIEGITSEMASFKI